jgi:hypothetical protein
MPSVTAKVLVMDNEQSHETKPSALKENAVVVAKVGGFMVFIAALGFIFFMIVLMLWMANP